MGEDFRVPVFGIQYLPKFRNRRLASWKCVILSLDLSMKQEGCFVFYPDPSHDCCTVDTQQVFVDDANLTRQIKQIHSQPVLLFGFVFKARKKNGDCPHLIESSVFCHSSRYIAVRFSIKFIQLNVRKNESNWTTNEHRGPKPFLNTETHHMGQCMGNQLE